MGWSASLKAALAQSQVSPRFYIEVLDSFSGKGPGQPGIWQPEYMGRIVGGGTSIVPGSWTPHLGAFTVEFQHPEPYSLAYSLVPGMMIAVRMGFRGWSPGSFERILVGRITGVQGLRHRLRVSAVDLVASLTTRFEQSDGEKLALFSDIPKSTTTSGGHLDSATTLTVGDTTGFVKETGGSGLLYIDDGTSNPYYLRWTGSTATTFTVETAGALGTAKPANTLSGATVRHVVYLRGHPMDIVRKLMASTGAGTNGAYDTYPEEWGFDIPDELLDHDDIDFHKAIVELSGGGYEWEVVHGPGDEAGGATDGIDNGYGWIRGWLEPAGLWAMTRQGQITVRCAQPAWGASVSRVHSKDVADADFSRMDRFPPTLEWFDPQVPLEYFGVRFQGPSSPSTDQTQDSTVIIGSLPAQRRKVRTLDYAWQSESNVLQEARDRLYWWDFVRPERLTARMSGLSMATMAAGDIVRATSRQVVGRGDGVDGWNSKRCMVLGCVPYWRDNYVQLILGAPPHPSGDFG